MYFSPPAIPPNPESGLKVLLATGRQCSEIMILPYVSAVSTKSCSSDDMPLNLAIPGKKVRKKSKRGGGGEGRGRRRKRKKRNKRKRPANSIKKKEEVEEK